MKWIMPWGDKDHNRYALGIVKNTGVSIYKTADKKVMPYTASKKAMMQP